MRFSWEAWKRAARSFLHCVEATTKRNAQEDIASISWGVDAKMIHDADPDPGTAPRWLFIEETQKTEVRRNGFVS